MCVCGGAIPFGTWSTPDQPTPPGLTADSMYNVSKHTAASCRGRGWLCVNYHNMTFITVESHQVSCRTEIYVRVHEILSKTWDLVALRISGQRGDPFIGWLFTFFRTLLG